MQTLKYDIQYNIRNTTVSIFREETRVPQFFQISEKRNLRKLHFTNCLQRLNLKWSEEKKIQYTHPTHLLLLVLYYIA